MRQYEGQQLLTGDQAEVYADHFFRSRSSRPLLASTLTVVAAGAVLPFTPLAGPLGFTSLPVTSFAALAAMVVAYLLLIEVGKRLFYAEPDRGVPPVRRRGHPHRIERRDGSTS